MFGVLDMPFFVAVDGRVLVLFSETKLLEWDFYVKWIENF